MSKQGKLLIISGFSGVGKGTAYEYFDSKEEIIVCALLYEIRTVTEQASHQIQTCPDLETQIHRMLLLVEEHSQCVDAIMAFLHLLTDENGLNISQRNVTVSTCGIVPRMRNRRKTGPWIFWSARS